MLQTAKDISMITFDDTVMNEHYECCLKWSKKDPETCGNPILEPFHKQNDEFFCIYVIDATLADKSGFFGDSSENVEAAIIASNLINPNCMRNGQGGFDIG